ncbi:MAG: hypothetical protein O2887_11775 [Bacteroidetes bacterium]|nr:hypothetical protein [Bacteroidota bacterium]MDA1121150.1 hypothetical protein [Bacteroidota bacterium]
MPTICDLVGIKPPNDRPVDGVSLLPLLKDQKQIVRQQPMLWYFYRSSPELAMRKGDHMLIARTNDTIPRTHHISNIDMSFIKDL